MKIYFAGPLFNIGEKNFNQSLTGKLEEMGHKVFLPQRDGVDQSKYPYNEMSPGERTKTLFTLDRDEIFKTDLFLFILDGRIPDEGASVALGIAYTHKLFKHEDKLLVGFHSDIRGAFPQEKLNPMIKTPLDYIVSSEDELIKLLNSLTD